MTPKRVLRSFSLWDSERKKGGWKRRRGGKSKFRQFLASIGHAVRPLFKDAEKALINRGKEKLAQRFGSEAINVGSRILANAVKQKSLAAAANSEEGRQLLRKGVQAGVESIKSKLGGADLNMPSDINNLLFSENKEKLAEAVQPKSRRRRRRRKSSVKKQVASKKRSQGGRRKKGGSQGGRRKKGGTVSKKKGARKKRGSGKKKVGGRKKTTVKGGRKKKSVLKKVAGKKKTKSKGKKQVKFNFGGGKKRGGGRGPVVVGKSIFD